MLDSRHGLAMVTRQIGDHGFFFAGKLWQRLHHNHLQGVAVMPLAADIVADVVQNGGVFQQFAVIALQLVQRLKFHKQRSRQAFHLMRVSRVVIIATGQFENGVEFWVHGSSRKKEKGERRK